MKKKILYFILVFSLAMNASILGAMGYQYYRNNLSKSSVPCPLSPTHEHLYHELGLSASQLTRMEPLAMKFHGRLGELRTAMEGMNGRLLTLLCQKDVDPGQVEGLRKEMAATQDEIQKEVIAHILETKKILEPGQQERFFSLMRQSMAFEFTDGKKGEK
jgi:hypothetical protein